MNTDRTAIELARDGTRAVFHHRGAKAWTHPEGALTMRDLGQTLSCPVCVPADQREVEFHGDGRKSACAQHGISEWGLLNTGLGYCRRCKRDRKAHLLARKTASQASQATHG